MDDLNFQRFVIFLIRFLSAISPLFKHNSDFYFIPIDVIYAKMDARKGDIDGLINEITRFEQSESEFGLELVSYDDIDSSKFKEFLKEVINFSNIARVSSDVSSKNGLGSLLSSIKCAADIYNEEYNDEEAATIADTGRGAPDRSASTGSVRHEIIIQKIYLDYFKFLNSWNNKTPNSKNNKTPNSKNNKTPNSGNNKISNSKNNEFYAGGAGSESVFKRSKYIHIKSVPDFIIKSSEFYDINDLFDLFNWKNFENFIGVILNYFGFTFLNNFRFSLSKSANLKHPIISKTTKKPQNRFEIDVVAIKSNHILFIDAKYWKKGSGAHAALEDAALTQASRVWALINDSEGLNKLISSFSTNIQRRFLKSAKRDNSTIHLYPIIVYSMGRRQISARWGNKTIPTRFRNNPLVHIIDIRNFHEFVKNKNYLNDDIEKNKADNADCKRSNKEFTCSLKNIQTLLI